MGQKGKEIVEVDIKDVIDDLNSAYADEWLSHFQYFLYAQIIEGIDAETLKKELEQQSMDEMNHAKILANRILQLGGTPTTKLRDFHMWIFTSTRRSNRSCTRNRIGIRSRKVCN